VHQSINQNVRNENMLVWSCTELDNLQFPSQETLTILTIGIRSRTLITPGGRGAGAGAGDILTYTRSDQPLTTTNGGSILVVRKPRLRFWQQQ
jgi:hypothetical protein